MTDGFGHHGGHHLTPAETGAALGAAMAFGQFSHQQARQTQLENLAAAYVSQGMLYVNAKAQARIDLNMPAPVRRKASPFSLFNLILLGGALYVGFYVVAFVYLVISSVITGQ